MTSGEFSRRSLLSIKALRLYDRLGLLRPASIGANGYRRYHEDQLLTARLIVMLRRLDMPLPEVARVVSASGPDAAALIDAYWASAEQRFAAQRQIVAVLRPGVAASSQGVRALPVGQRDVPAQTVLTEQRHVYVGELTWIRDAAARLGARAALCGGVVGERFVIFHGTVTIDSDGPVEVCLPVSHPPADPADAACRVEPAHREAFIHVTRANFDVPAIWSVYDQLERWVTAEGRRRTGAPREVYRHDADSVATDARADQRICDVAVPFARSG
jgi:DNA-binding transcriptional MerR regulator